MPRRNIRLNETNPLAPGLLPIRSTRVVRTVLKPIVFGLSLLPVATYAWDAVHGQLGLRPDRRLLDDSGVWALWFLVFTFLLTPVRRLTGWHWPNVFRRMLGLFAFFYASIHTLAYVVFAPLVAARMDARGGVWSTAGRTLTLIALEIADKPFIALGAVAFASLIPLAMTSSADMIRRLGGRRWRRLHRLVFVAIAAGALHHWWPLADRFRTDTYAVLIALSVVVRLAWWWSIFRRDIAGARVRSTG